jgi:hypothetical protein
MASGGGLLDLVARGKKDTFFTQNPKISFFHSVYPKAGPSTQEIRLTQPRNRPEWGKWTDFDIEFVGDIMRNPVLLIDLPTWLPIAQARQNSTSITTDLSGVQYGYSQDVGVLMIEKVQLFMDQYLVHEFWGQWLEWRASSDSLAPIFGALCGRRTTPLCKSANPKQLRVYLPLLGNQAIGDRGFPLVAFHKQNFRIRVHLRKLEDLIEASDGRLNPTPWQRDFIQKTSKTAPPTQFKTLPRSLIPGPLIALETTQVYIPRDAQELLKKTVLNIPFRQIQLCQFTIEDSKWSPIVNTNSPVTLPLSLDFVGAMSKITVGIQTESSIRAGQRYNLAPPPGGPNQFIQSLRLNTGTKDRLNEWQATIWRDVSNYYKNEREARDPLENPLNIYTMTFGGGDIHTPLGTFNMSRSDTQVLYVSLAAIANDSRSNSRKAYIYVFGESWNILEVKDGKARLLFAN